MNDNDLQYETGVVVRAWVNQPSTLQPYHELHGQNVLYSPKEKRIYFLSGAVISQEIDPLALSKGWHEHVIYYN